MRRRKGRRGSEFTVEPELEIDGEEVEGLEVDVYVSPYLPAKTYGPPEKCYPAEGGDAEEWTVWQRVGGKRIRRADLDDSFTADELMELVDTQADWDEGPDPDDAYERARDRELDREADGYDRRFEREDW